MVHTLLTEGLIVRIFIRLPDGWPLSIRAQGRRPAPAVGTGGQLIKLCRSWPGSPPTATAAQCCICAPKRAMTLLG
jgi:hypothetical protein